MIAVLYNAEIYEVYENFEKSTPEEARLEPIFFLTFLNYFPFGYAENQVNKLERNLRHKIL